MITVSIASGIMDVAGAVIKTISLPLLVPGRIYAITAHQIAGSSAFTPRAGSPIDLGPELKGESLQLVNELIDFSTACK